MKKTMLINKGLEWRIPPVDKEQDSEEIIGDDMTSVAMEFLGGNNKRRKYKKNQE